jgi:hypothetical protein
MQNEIGIVLCGTVGRVDGYADVSSTTNVICLFEDWR